MSKKMIMEPNEIQAVLMGFLIKNYNKVQTAKINKLLKELNIDRMTVVELKEFNEVVGENEHLNDLVSQAIEGEVGLANLVKNGTKDVTPLKDVDPNEIITPSIVSHQRNLRNNRAFNKQRREGAYYQILLDNMKEDMVGEFKDILHNIIPQLRDEDFELKLKGSSLVVTLADIHVGKVVNRHPSIGVGYDFEILTSRLGRYLDEIRGMFSLMEVDNIRLYFLGDAIENADMRNDQSFHSEFDTSEQLSKATRVIYDFLSSLEEMAPVRFGMVSGNHDRLTGTRNKKDKIYNDSAVYTILDSLFFLQEQGLLQNTDIIDNRDAVHIFTDYVQGMKIVCNHGDMIRGNRAINQLGIPNVKYLITAHKHHFHMKQEDEDSYHMQVNSVIGNDTYASEGLMSNNTIPSQTMMVINSDVLKAPFIYTPFLEEGF